MFRLFKMSLLASMLFFVSCGSSSSTKNDDYETKTRTVKGTLLAPTPVSGAIVWASDNNDKAVSQTTQTDEKGFYSLKIPTTQKKFKVHFEGGKIVDFGLDLVGIKLETSKTGTVHLNQMADLGLSELSNAFVLQYVKDLSKTFANVAEASEMIKDNNLSSDDENITAILQITQKDQELNTTKKELLNLAIVEILKENNASWDYDDSSFLSGLDDLSIEILKNNDNIFPSKIGRANVFQHLWQEDVLKYENIKNGSFSLESNATILTDFSHMDAINILLRLIDPKKTEEQLRNYFFASTASAYFKIQLIMSNVLDASVSDYVQGAIAKGMAEFGMIKEAHFIINYKVHLPRNKIQSLYEHAKILDSLGKDGKNTLQRAFDLVEQNFNAQELSKEDANFLLKMHKLAKKMGQDLGVFAQLEKYYSQMDTDKKKLFVGDCFLALNKPEFLSEEFADFFKDKATEITHKVALIKAYTKLEKKDKAEEILVEFNKLTESEKKSELEELVQSYWFVGMLDDLLTQANNLKTSSKSIYLAIMHEAAQYRLIDKIKTNNSSIEPFKDFNLSIPTDQVVKAKALQKGIDWAIDNNHSSQASDYLTQLENLMKDYSETAATNSLAKVNCLDLASLQKKASKSVNITACYERLSEVLKKTTSGADPVRLNLEIVASKMQMGVNYDSDVKKFDTYFNKDKNIYGYADVLKFMDILHQEHNKTELVFSLYKKLLHQIENDAPIVIINPRIKVFFEHYFIFMDGLKNSAGKDGLSERNQEIINELKLGAKQIVFCAKMDKGLGITVYSGTSGSAVLARALALNGFEKEAVDFITNNVKNVFEKKKKPFTRIMQNELLQVVALGVATQDEFPKYDFAKFDFDKDGKPDFFSPLGSHDELSIDDDIDNDGVKNDTDLKPYAK